jgi:FAD:protein FMN transferase
MMQTEFQAMGSHISILLDADTPETTLALNQVPVWFEEWEQSLSRFRENSELTMVNRSAGTRVRVSPTFWQVLQIALDMEIASEGLVTPAVLDALETIGYKHSFAGGVPDTVLQTENPNFATTDVTEIQLFPESQEIRLPEGMRLDFGGTAKGWAAHQTMLRLAKFGPILVNAGGDISISGLQTDGTPWKVGIIDPLQPAMDMVRLTVGSCGVATSGKDYRKWLQDGILRHHIIDPRTGLPAETDILSASVSAPTVMEAEMAAKVLFILGSEDGADWLKQQPQLGSLLVLDDGEVLISQTLKRNLGG